MEWNAMNNHQHLLQHVTCQDYFNVKTISYIFTSKDQNRLFSFNMGGALPYINAYVKSQYYLI